MVPPPVSSNGNDLHEIHCSSCGRFLGKGHIVEGELYLLCKNCKNWTVVTEGKAELNLTGDAIYRKLRPKTPLTESVKQV